MKFLCVACDEVMTLRETRGPDSGSMSVIFGCPICGRETAMLTNAMETQVVRSLGVKIGGREVPAEPMEMLRGSLEGSIEAAPFTHAGMHSSHSSPARESKCPFTGMVDEAFTRTEISWTEEARLRAERIPSFARSMAMKSVEDYAAQKGYPEITDGWWQRDCGALRTVYSRLLHAARWAEALRKMVFRERESQTGRLDHRTAEFVASPSGQWQPPAQIPRTRLIDLPCGPSRNSERP